MNPALKFVVLFIGSYLLMQFLYTSYLWIFQPEIDPLTLYTAKLLLPLFNQSTLIEIPGAAKVQFQINGKAIVNVKEACNGLSVFIALLSFLLAYHGEKRKYLVFIPMSVLVIFLGNLLRLYALIQIKQLYPASFVFFHEYLFPIILYLFAFGIMVVWVKTIHKSAETSSK
jgi:exosortase family protein XrtF